MDLTPYLKLMADKHASDLFLSVGAPPCLKVEGFTRHLSDTPLTTADVHGMAASVMTERQQRDYDANWEMNLALAPAGIGRFRINVYRQRGEPAMAVRYITAQIPTIAQLNLPPLLEDVVMLQRGLVLMVGASGSGKSTTLAAMIDHRNRNRTGHILTVEEPIEYVHSHKLSIVDQREVGFDTHSYGDALKNAMREAPDVIMIGEIRDRETMQAAIAYADTGHLCLSTLHASNASQTLDRIINFFPESARAQLLIDLSLNLKAVIGQRLVKGRRTRLVPAVEILLQTPYTADLIGKGEVSAIRDAMKAGADVGMQTFDQALYALYAAGEITFDEALAHADSKTDLALHARLHDTTEADDHGMTLEEPGEPRLAAGPGAPPARKEPGGQP
jgi:twitching motility protein PilU